MKYIGLDYGEKTIGVAVSHNGRVAAGVTTLRRKDPAALRPSLKELKAIIREHGIKCIVLGLPKNADGGDDNTRSAETLDFKEKLTRYFKNIKIILWDERYSTQAVTRTFDGKRVNYKKNVDEMAAVYILQGYLDFKNQGGDLQMTDENYNVEDDGDEGGELVIVTEEGEERPLQILASREDGDDIYLLALEGEEGEVYHFKANPSDDDDEDIMLEQIDPEHEDYARVFDMFKEDYEELGIDIEDIAN
ncbi:MAG: Holliday junction resolvase RuvX [Defluviitaleaceae bacterium]|nr:Holliday junction resolvase RuvX [Defluviitaleaceae bacterium]